MSDPAGAAAEAGVLTPERAELVARMAALGPKFAERAPTHDRDASFPHENWEDLAGAGFLGLCVPAHAGGLGADFVGYALVAEEMGRHCATTALTFNMHTATALLAGPIADALLAGGRGTALDPDGTMAAHLDATRPGLWEGMVYGRMIHSQPFSEGQAPGARSGFSTRAVPTDGGYLVTGRKIFASLSGAAHVHNVLALVDGDPRLRLLGVPAGADGVEIVGDWDPIGMRGTDSRTLVMDEVFVPAANEVLPPGMFNAMISGFPQFYMSLTFSYLGLMRAILDTTRTYLRGESGVKAARDHPIKQTGWAQLQLLYDRAQSLTYRVLGEIGADPTPQQLRRAHAATITTMESAPEMASLALRTCGGRSLLRPGRLEQHYRDARCGATMLPWSVEELLVRLGRNGLYDEAKRRS
ncbi:acyl-CoA dehydrogenase family protein [Candidatus Poriferisodalis sp.]|uniref:acyl-CoA dehydrogenase family protein n=1 Tax=Candidatus Poriferisodalis sp. TaxID=3101277 RepID=UPI003B01D79B